MTAISRAVKIAANAARAIGSDTPRGCALWAIRLVGASCSVCVPLFLLGVYGVIQSQAASQKQSLEALSEIRKEDESIRDLFVEELSGVKQEVARITSLGILPEAARRIDALAERVDRMDATLADVAPADVRREVIESKLELIERIIAIEHRLAPAQSEDTPHGKDSGGDAP